MCNSDGTWSDSAPTCICESPASPLNGLVTDDGETASYTCNQGYSMNGLPIRTCGTDGSGWSGTAPACSTCVTLSSLSGGSVELSTNGLNTQAEYTCNTGYTLNGVNLISCRSDGTWDFTAPSCEKCQDLSDPASGSVALTTTGLVTTATFTCQTGYYLKGEFSISCDSDGKWSNDAPSCQCDYPPQLSNGEVSLSGTGTVATYRCDTGYTLGGLSSRTCQTDGTGWEDSDPQCILCETISNPSSGSLSLSTNGTHTTAKYSCAVETSLDGESEIMCKVDGSWATSPPTCVQCPDLSDPDSGSVSLTTNGLSTSATFSCVTGYTLNSTGILNCLSSGTWDIQLPFCICQSPPLISNGQFNISSDLRTVTYTCNVGYVLVGSVTRTCQDDGTGWDGISPVCDTAEPDTGASCDGTTWQIPIAAMIIFVLLFVCLAILLSGLTHLYCRLKKKTLKIESREPSRQDELSEFCNPLSNPVGGSYSLSTDGLTTTANYSCVAGYTLVGSNERACQLDKFWSPSSPTCVQCDGLNVLSSGDISITTDGFISTAHYFCVAGYTLVGMSTRSCQSDGTWNGTAPVCDCDPPSAPINGAVVANGKTANYTCNLNHTLLGLQVRTCQVDGTGWSDVDPQCNLCQTVVTPIGGIFTLSTTGTQTYALYYCENGYTLSGAYKAYCQYTGSWDPIPTCVQCDTLLAPDSGTVTTTTTGRITTATYSCASGYTLNGASERNCQPSGTWDFTAPNCTCQSPLGLQNGHVTDDGITAAYTCDVGYSLDGASTRTCAKDGTWWTGSDPVCNPCTTLTPATGGTVTMKTNGQMTTAVYTCDLGYTLDGLDNITCRSDGTWDFSQPQCAMCPTLTDPASGSVSMTTDTKTTTATFTCATEYYVSGPLKITCEHNGIWSSSPPTCKCLTPGSPDFGSVSVSDQTQGPVARYLCDIGYSIDGLASRQCMGDGSGWEGTDPTCSHCDSVSTSPELTFSMSTNGSTTSGKYACALNYTLSGEDLHICQSDGTWNRPMPTCVSCTSKQAPSSGYVTFATDGIRTVATFTCVFGYDLTSSGIITCQTDGTWDLPDPLCVCQPPSAVINGHYELSSGGMAANYSCDDDYELVGPQQRLCFTDGTGWNGTEPRCDLIIPTTPKIGQSKEETVLPIPSAAFIALVVIVIILVISLMTIAVCSYLRYRKERQRIGTTFDSADSRPISSDEPRFNFESPDLEDGKSLLIMKETEPAKSMFNANSLKKKSSMRSVDLSPSESGLSSKEKIGSVPQSGSEKPFENGTPPHVPLSAVRLPKLPPKSPAKNVKKEALRHKRKRRRVERQEDTSAPADSAAEIKDAKPRTSTPIEIVMNRTQTPDILSSEHFEYIQPVYCHEVETPAPSRPTTATTRASSRPSTSKTSRKEETNESNV